MGDILVMLADPVPLTIVQDAFRRSNMTITELADHLEWYDIRGKPDGTRTRRALGLGAATGGNGFNKTRVETSYDNAVMMIRAMGFAPVDFDL